MKKIVPQIVLAGVMVRNSKILLLQRSDDEKVYPGLWELPSGKKGVLEKSEVSLIRELKEETGLETEIDRLISIFDYQIEKPEFIRDTTQINFLIRVLGDDEVKLSIEHQSHAWITSEDLLKYNISEETKKVLNKAFKLL